MPFALNHKLSSYLLVSTAAISLLLSPDVPAFASLLTLLSIIGSWFAEPSRYRLQRLTPLWNLATIAFLVYQALRVVQGASAIEAGVYFLLFLLINKLFNRRSSKDYQQAYLVSLLMLVAATTLNTGLSFAICFTLYVLFATWTLSLFHLRCELEEDQKLQQSERLDVDRVLQSRRIIGARFLVGSSLLSLGVLVGAMAVFTLFPRVGFGLFARAKRHGVAMSGFSEHVELGHHGAVRTNPQVVLRVVFPRHGRQLPVPAETIRWRGSVYDRYEEGTWSHSADLLGRTIPVAPVDGLYWINHAPGLPVTATPRFIRDQLLQQEIYLEPLGSSVLFGADRPVAVEVKRRKVLRNRPIFVPRRGPLGELRAAKRQTAGVRYLAFSKLHRSPPNVMREAVELTEPRLQRFLRLPANLPSRVVALAKQLTRDKPTIYDQVLAVQDHLQRNYRYTLQLSHEAGREPVDEFLFETKAGHCEYFASALAVLLRAAGIPTRHVNGFLGGQWNEYGDYLAVRQADAHAWTEVLLSNIGWVAFDATPPRDRAAPVAAGMLRTLRQMADAVRLRWFRYVIEYDLSKQINLAKEVGALAWPDVTRKATRRGAPARRAALRYVLGALLLCLLLGAIAVYVRRRLIRRAQGTLSGRQRHRHPATVLYTRALHHLETRAQIPKPPAVTARQLADRLLREKVPCAGLVDEVTRCYYAARFGGRADENASNVQLERLVGRLRRALRSRAGSEAPR